MRKPKAPGEQYFRAYRRFSKKHSKDTKLIREIDRLIRLVQLWTILATLEGHK